MAFNAAVGSAQQVAVIQYPNGTQSAILYDTGSLDYLESLQGVSITITNQAALSQARLPAENHTYYPITDLEEDQPRRTSSSSRICQIFKHIFCDATKGAAYGFVVGFTAGSIIATPLFGVITGLILALKLFLLVFVISLCTGLIIGNP